MRAGRLNRRVTLQKPSVPQGVTGAAVHNYTDMQTVWAAVKPLRGEEFHRAAKDSSSITHEVTLRHYKGLDATWRVLYGQRILAIKAVTTVLENRREMTLMCRETTSGEES